MIEFVFKGRMGTVYTSVPQLPVYLPYLHQEYIHFKKDKKLDVKHFKNKASKCNTQTK